MNTNHTVTFMPLAEENYLKILDWAKSEAIEDSISFAMKQAVELIRSDAVNAGEPVYNLKQMKMRVCRILVPPLYVEYGVHFTKPLAFIRRVVLLRKPS